MDDMEQLKLLLERGLITEEDYAKQKRQAAQNRKQKFESPQNGGTPSQEGRRSKSRADVTGIRHGSRSSKGRPRPRPKSRPPKSNRPSGSTRPPQSRPPQPNPFAQQPEDAESVPTPSAGYQCNVVHFRFVSSPLGKDCGRNLFYEHENHQALEVEYAEKLQEFLNRYTSKGWKLKTIDRNHSHRISMYGNRPGDASQREKEYRIARDLVIIFEKQ